MRLFLRSAGFFSLRRTLASNVSIPPRRRPIAPSSAFVRVHARPRPFQALRSCRLKVVTEGLCTRRARVPETGDRGLRGSPSTLRTCCLKGRIVHFGPAGRIADSRDASHTMTWILEASRGASYSLHFATLRKGCQSTLQLLRCLRAHCLYCIWPSLCVSLLAVHTERC